MGPTKKEKKDVDEALAEFQKELDVLIEQCIEDVHKHAQQYDRQRRKLRGRKSCYRRPLLYQRY
jgi:hypothetical protein